MTTSDATSEVVTPARQPPPGPLTFEQFHDWLDEDTWAEWVNGEVQMVSPSADPHADLADFLTAILRDWVETYDLGIVRSAPFLMRLGAPVNRGREPDLLFIAREHLSRRRRTYLDGPADAVIEIVSPESFARDRGEKFVEYEQAGVPEYWMLDRDRRWAEFYQLGPDGRYEPVFAGRSGVYESRALRGLRLPVDWLWQEPLPKLVEARRALGLVG